MAAEGGAEKERAPTIAELAQVGGQGLGAGLTARRQDRPECGPFVLSSVESLPTPASV